MSYAFPPGRLPTAGQYYATMPLWDPPGVACGCGVNGLGTEDPNAGAGAGSGSTSVTGAAGEESLAGEGSDVWYAIGAATGILLGLVGGAMFGMMAYPPPQKPLPPRSAY